MALIAAVSWVSVGADFPSPVADGSRSSTINPVTNAATRPAGDPARVARPALRDSGGSTAARPAEPEAAAVLRRWDRRRATAYASGSARALRELYVGDAGAGDVRLLRSYLRRGYRVEGLRMQLLAVRVRHHAAGRWRLRVTDRLAGGAVAVGYGERVALPRDRASVRTVVLRRGGDGRWRMAAVRPSTRR